ncbi:MAG TPA: hypothetical protein VMJ72_01265 [Candidatus Paceibacterota bacterium]|nr:hypothetical protein [Candidatus Paceibacterota bacterium]
MAKTFAELEAQEAVTPAEFMETLEHYAANGVHISAKAIIRLMHRVSLTSEQKAKAHQCLVAGCRCQERKGRRRLADEYGAVATLVVLS